MDRMTTTSSLVDTVPSPSLSKSAKASLKSSLYSGVSIVAYVKLGCYYCLPFIIILLNLIII
jgi:hypothetical protein